MVDRKKQKITSKYGGRGDHFHKGIDLRTWDLKFWKPQLIVFPEHCTVIRMWSDAWGEGMAVKPLESTQFDELKFIHVKFKPWILKGNSYKKGVAMGYSMLTKLCKSHHLHFEVWAALRHVDPELYLEFRGIDYA